MAGTSPAPSPPSFADLLRQHRLTAGLSQERLAERSGLSVRGLSDLERGARRRPQAETLRLLAEALGLTPAERAGLAMAAHGEAVPPPAPAAHGGAPARPSLPVPPTPLVGRGRELVLLNDWLRGDAARLVTVTGPGGVGKTRLAVAAAEAAADSYPGGVWFVDLAPLRDAGAVLPTIVAALGLRWSPELSAAEAIVARLRDERALLLLDNGEQVLAAGPDLAAVLAGCPRLVVLSTSREPWRLRAERDLPLRPLPVPDERGDRSPERLATVPAVDLFVQRAAAADAGFALDAANAADVAAICRRLDGLPLAIELAAAWTRLLPPRALLARLASRPLDLVGGWADAPARHQSLRETIAWSHDLLAPDEQRLFRRLALCAGGFTLDGAEAVANPRLDLGRDVVDGLGSLVDDSLVYRRPGDGPDRGEPRFAMLQTIREYALEQLEASGESEATWQALRSHLLALAERAEPHLEGAEPARWLDALEADHDNFRVVLADAVRRGDADLALGLAIRLWRFWLTRGHEGEGRAWLERALAAGGGGPRDLRVRARQSLGHLAFDLGDYGEAEVHFNASLALCRAAGDRRGEAESLSGLAVVALNRLQYAEAGALLEEALALARELGDAPGVAAALYLLAIVARERGEQAAAGPLFEEALGMWRAQGNTARVGQTLLGLGMVRRFEEDAPAARRLIEEARAILEQVGYRYWVAATSMQLGHVARLEGDERRAARHYADSLARAGELGANEMAVEDVEFLACVLTSLGDPLRAARLFGAGAAMRVAHALPPPMATETVILDRHLALAREAAGDDWDAAWAAGRALDPERATAEAAAVAEELAGPGPGA